MDEPAKIEEVPAGKTTATNTMKISIVAVSVAIRALLGVVGVAFGLKSNHEVTFPTPYQAVLLANGAVYYAKVQGYGTPVLMDVF